MKVNEIIFGFRKKWNEERAVFVEYMSENLPTFLNSCMDEADFNLEQAKLMTIKIFNLLLAKYEYKNNYINLMSMPFHLKFDPSNACQLRCPGCIHSEKFKCKENYGTENMDIKLYDNFIESYGAYAFSMSCYFYGEPFLNKNTPEMILKARQYGMTVNVSSNLSLELDCTNIVNCGLDNLVCSIDGLTQEAYEKYRRGGSVDKIFSNIKKIAEEKCRSKRKNPNIVWQFLTFEHNEHEVELAITFAESIGVNQINIATPNSVTYEDETIIEVEHPKMGWKSLDSFDWNGYIKNAELMFQNLNKDKINMQFENFQIALKNCKLYGEEKSDNFEKCDWLYGTIVLDSRGIVMPCCKSKPEIGRTDNVLGSIYNDKDIYNTKKTMQARGNSRFLPECKDCTAKRNVDYSLEHVRRDLQNFAFYELLNEENINDVTQWEKNMEFTGERLVLGQVNYELEVEHINRYEFAEQFVKGKTVLDAACGTGYGSSILSKQAQRVKGIDLDAETVQFARKQYACENIEFKEASIEKLPFDESEFDVVVSFETIEHVAEAVQTKFIEEIQRTLKENGILIISTPNKEIYKKHGQNEFHLHELDFNEFETLLKKYFKNVKVLVQQYEVCNVISEVTQKNSTINSELLAEKAEYLIAICSNEPLPNMNSNVLVRKDDKLNQLTDWAINTHNLNEKNNQYIATKEKEIGALKEQNDELIIMKNNLHIQINECKQENDQLEQANMQLGQQNVQLEQQNVQLEQQDVQMKQQAVRMEQHINDANQIITNKEGHIQQLLEAEREFERFKQSRSWRYMSYVWKISKVILPHGSKRRLVAKIGLKFIKHPIKFMRKMSPSRIKKALFYLKREGVDSVSKRLDNCVVSPQINKTSFILHPVEQNKSKDDYEKIAIKSCDSPKVSIVIPVYNQFEYTYNCIKSIVENSGDVAYEILIANDCSSDLTVEIDSIIEGAILINNKDNMRFLKNCNNAAKQASGQYILFLNNDTQVQKDWLRPLVELIESDESIGLVGSKLVYPDGSLQEAGGILWKDGSAWNYGNGSDPAAPEYNYVKEVDYISGASILITRELWDEIGGFDERYTPAYYEDSDLAFEVRKRGYKVMYQPLSVVVHFEGKSNGTDLTQGQKSYQLVNQEKFCAKWKEELNEFNFKNGENVFLARDRSRNKKCILFIDHYVPTFDQDTGSRAAFAHIGMFVKMGYNIKFLGDNFYKNEPYATAIEQMGVEFLYGNYYAQNWSNWIKKNGQYFSVVILSRPHISIKYIDCIKKETKAKIIYYCHDLHFLREQRQYEITGASDLLKSSKKWEEQEGKLISETDVTFTFSVDEEQIICEKFGKNKATVAPIFFYEKEEVDTNRRTEVLCNDIIFVGGYGHQPNIDAAVWLVEKIWPSIKAQIADARLVLIGSKPTKEVLNLATEDIVVTGYISDQELENHYANCRVCVIPLRYGAGVKGKTLEAMYFGSPIVSTPIGIEGMLDICNYLTSYDDAESFAQRTVELYEDRDLCKEVSASQKEYLKNYFSVDKALEFFKYEFEK